jgi:hypothetical protein
MNPSASRPEFNQLMMTEIIRIYDKSGDYSQECRIWQVGPDDSGGD